MFVFLDEREDSINDGWFASDPDNIVDECRESALHGFRCKGDRVSLAASSWGAHWKLRSDELNTRFPSRIKIAEPELGTGQKPRAEQAVGVV
jgi:hypothetical protein